MVAEIIDRCGTFVMQGCLGRAAVWTPEGTSSHMARTLAMPFLLVVVLLWKCSKENRQPAGATMITRNSGFELGNLAELWKLQVTKVTLRLAEDWGQGLISQCETPNHFTKKFTIVIIFLDSST